jgi:hypothetical protein
MKFTCFIAIILLFLTGNLSAKILFPGDAVMVNDTIPDPPGGPVSLSGPDSACTGDTCQYSTEVPVACSCRWYINEVLQSGTSPEIDIVWAGDGLQEVAVAFLCSDGQLSDPETLDVSVYGIPNPAPIEGDDIVCANTFHTYSTTAGPLDSFEWTVNGVVQPGSGPSIDYTFGEAGLYTFEVVAYNPCGSSNPQSLEVTAQGNAPAPPSPIQGPGLSCEGSTETYTTTVGNGESCEWWVDGVLHSSGSTTLTVNWDIRGGHLLEARAVGTCGTGNPTYKTVEVFYDPSVFLGNDTAIIQGQSLMLDAGNPGSDYLWSTGETTQTITVSFTGDYSVDVSNYCGADSDTIAISVFIGITESTMHDECFHVSSSNGIVYLSDLPEDSRQLQIINMTGQTLYSGKPEKSVSLQMPGVYFIRLILTDHACLSKVIIQ